MIAIIDYGVGNLHSIGSALGFLGYDYEITSDPNRILDAERVILPGVGAFGDAMKRLSETGLSAPVRDAAAGGIPLLGICVGMQLLFEESFEFGRHDGLGLLQGRICSMDEDLSRTGLKLKIPQIGWNNLVITKKDCIVLNNTRDGEFFYFVHSYYAKDCTSTAAFSEYGLRVPAVVSSGNIFGCQFHPEKSGQAGLRLLKAFCK